MKYSVIELYDNIFDFPRELGTGQCLVELSLTSGIFCQEKGNGFILNLAFSSLVGLYWMLRHFNSTNVFSSPFVVRQTKNKMFIEHTTAVTIQNVKKHVYLVRFCLHIISLNR